MNRKTHIPCFHCISKLISLTLVTLIIGCKKDISKPHREGQFILDSYDFHGLLIDSTDTTMTWMLDYSIVYHFENTGAKISAWTVGWASLDPTCNIGIGISMLTLGLPTYFLKEGIRDTISYIGFELTFPCPVAPLDVSFSIKGYLLSYEDEPIDSLESLWYYHAHLDTLYP